MFKLINRHRSLVAIVATMLLIVAHDYLPQRSMSLLHLPSSGFTLFEAYNNQQPVNTWQDKANFHFVCQSNVAIGAAQLCGIDFFFTLDFTRGIDLSVYDELRLSLNIQGPTEFVRFYLRHHNPAYYKEGDANTNKYMAVEINTSEFAEAHEVKVPLTQLRVANWWLRMSGVSRKYISPELNNITSVGVDLSPYLGFGETSVQINAITFSGSFVKQQHWYLGILVFWMLFVGGAASSKYVLLLKSKTFYEKESQRYQRLSNIDSLTGALNRVGIEKNIRNIAVGKSLVDIGIIFIDIDHFKLINDTHGHDGGDIVLKTLVDLVKKNIRAPDLFGRWGGEEFVLILPETTEKTAMDVAEKIRRMVADHAFLDDTLLKVTASFGVAILRESSDFESALKRADQALYSAKERGRNCCVMAGELS